MGVGTSVWWYPHCLRAELVAKGVYCYRQSARWIRGLAVSCRRQNSRVCQRDTVHREDAALVRFGYIGFSPHRCQQVRFALQLVCGTTNSPV